MDYVQRLLDTAAMREWYADGLKETVRDQPHEEEILAVGQVLEDLRAT
jgi:glutathione S-transferase